jgi:hypothetical protein
MVVPIILSAILLHPVSQRVKNVPIVADLLFQEYVAENTV